jgi:hypothetical protein
MARNLFSKPCVGSQFGALKGLSSFSQQIDSVSGTKQELSQHETFLKVLHEFARGLPIQNEMRNSDVWVLDHQMHK